MMHQRSAHVLHAAVRRPLAPSRPLVAQERMARREHIQPVGLQELEDQLQMANEASPY